MNDDLLQREQLSALADGEAQHAYMQAALSYAESDEGQQTWRMYHVIGDVLRSPELAHHSQHNLLPGLRQRLLEEPARKPQGLEQGVLSSVASAVQQQAVGNGAPVVQLGREAANASVFRWKMAAGVASVAAVAAIGWSVMLGTSASSQMPQAAQLAQSTQAAPVLAAATDRQAPQALLAARNAVEPPLGAGAQSSAVVAVEGPHGQSMMLRDPRLDELLAAQTEQGSAPSLQMPASFLRNASFATTGGK